MIPICETAKLLQLRKAKYSILSSILHIFQKMLLKGPYTCTIHCINLMIFLYSVLNLDILFSKNVTFQKNSFCHSFLSKI